MKRDYFLGELTSTPVSRNSMEQLSVAEDKLAAVMTRLLGVDIFNKKLEMDEERFVPEGLGYKTDLFEEEEKVRILFWILMYIGDAFLVTSLFILYW